jgi:predicted DNA-binding protein YlxM (UPF0122 family)
MEISISEAAKMVKVSRNTIYDKLKSGELSRCPSGKVETSEILRVFGNSAGRHTRQEQKTHVQSVHSVQPEDTKTEQLYQAQIRTLEEALRQAQERESWQRGQIERLTDTLKLLEAPKKTTTARGWFERLMGRS